MMMMMMMTMMMISRSAAKILANVFAKIIYRTSSSPSNKDYEDVLLL